MRVTIQKIGPTVGTVLDATPYLDETEKQMLTQELEFNAFQRTMPDVSFSLSNLSDTFSTLFSGMRVTHLYEVDVYDDTGRRRFWGYVDNKTVTFLLRDRYAKLSAYSGLKRFWDKAKTTKLYIPTTGDPFGKTVTVSYCLWFQMISTDIRENFTTFLNLDLGDFANETIRGYDGANYRGTFQNLKQDTTWYDLLTAFSLFYNAEFYIDPEDRSLRMVHRTSILNDRQLDLDDRLCDDEDVEATAVDSKRVDYLKSFSWFTVAAPSMAYKPTAIGDGNPWIPYGVQAGTHYYKVVYYTNGQPVMISDVLEVSVPTVPSGSSGWKIWLNIPAHPAGAGDRQVYRSDPIDPEGGWYLAYSLAPSDAADKVIGDVVHWDFLHLAAQIPNVDRRVEAWFSWDEITGNWTTIVDAPKGANTPTGTVFNIIPALHFMNPYNRDVQTEDDPFNVFDFFMQRFNTAEEYTRTRWADLFRTRRTVKCKVTGTDYEVGDSVVSSMGLFPNDLTADKRLVIRKATCNLMENTSHLELVTV
jgi:hypothetical protein